MQANDARFKAIPEFAGIRQADSGHALLALSQLILVHRLFCSGCRLRSQTVETAAQEVAAMIIGSSLIARERAQLNPGEDLQHRISFLKTWETRRLFG